MPRPFQISGLNISSLAPIGKARRGPGMINTFDLPNID